MIRRKRRRKSGAPSSGAATRRDDKGISWRKAEVQTAVFAILANLSGTVASGITRRTQLGRDLGWDDWYKLSIVKPVRRQLHETLDHRVVKVDVKTAGNVVDYVWSLMEEI